MTALCKAHGKPLASEDDRAEHHCPCAMCQSVCWECAPETPAEPRGIDPAWLGTHGPLTFAAPNPRLCADCGKLPADAWFSVCDACWGDRCRGVGRAFYDVDHRDHLQTISTPTASYPHATAADYYDRKAREVFEIADYADRRRAILQAFAEVAERARGGR